jgi:hypothetical protein
MQQDNLLKRKVAESTQHERRVEGLWKKIDENLKKIKELLTKLGK